MTRVTEHPKHFPFEIVRLAFYVPTTDAGQLHTNPRLLVKMFSDAVGKLSMKEAFEPDPLSIDDRLCLIDHFSLCLNQCEIIKVGLRGYIRSAEIDIRLFLESLHNLVGHEISRKTLIGFRSIIN